MIKVLKTLARLKTVRSVEDKGGAGAEEIVPRVLLGAIKEKGSRACLDSGANRAARTKNEEERLTGEGLERIGVELADGSIKILEANSSHTIVSNDPIQPIVPLIPVLEMLGLKLKRNGPVGSFHLIHPLKGRIPLYHDANVLELEEQDGLDLITELEQARSSGEVEDKKEQQVEECVKSLLGLGWDVGRIAKALVEPEAETDSVTDDKTDETATCTTDDDMPDLEPVVENLLSSEEEV